MKRNEFLQDAIGQIDDDLILGAKQAKPLAAKAVRPLYRVIALAATLALLLASVSVMLLISNRKEPPKEPFPIETDETTADTSVGGNTMSPDTMPPDTALPDTLLPDTNPSETNAPSPSMTEPPVTKPPSSGNSATITTLPPSIHYDPDDFGNPDGTPAPFRILVNQDRHAWLHGTEQASDRVSLAAYQRNQKLYQLYNIELLLTEAATSASTWRGMLDAADGNISLTVPDPLWALEYEGFFINLAKRPEIALTQSHWMQGLNDSLYLNNRLYTVAGDASLELMAHWEVLFYNRDLAKALDYHEGLTALVEGNQWTVTEMMLILDDFALALLDNRSDNDILGAIYDSRAMSAQLYSAGLSLLEINCYTNIINDISNTQKNMELTADVTALRHHQALQYTGDEVGMDRFLAKQALFYANTLQSGRVLRDAADFDYGILLLPKHARDDDPVTTGAHVSTFAIPHSVANKRASAVILNTMNWLSDTEDSRGMGEHRLVRVYFDSLIKSESPYKTEDLAMLDQIKSSVAYDFGALTATQNPLQSAFETSVHTKVSPSEALRNISKKAEESILDMMTFYGDPAYAN